MAAHSQPLVPKKRLDSWKEIAAFFGRDERTVKRWEKERGLPVYRVPGSSRGGVFAYAEELTEWLKAPSHASAVTEIALPENPPSDESGSRIPAAASPSTVVTAIPAADPSPIKPILVAPVLNPRSVRASTMAAAKPFLWLLPLALIVGSFLIFSFGHREPRFKNALAAPHIPNAEAQDLYLKGRYYFEKRTPDDLNKAVDFFTQAIVHDPAYPAPYVGLADTYNLLREYSAMLPQEAFPRALAAATKAVELDPNSAEAHNSLAFASFWGSFDATTADREFRRAIELDPNLARAHHWYATFLINIHRDQEALAEIERARQLDPSSTPILADKGIILATSGRTEEARSLLTQLTAAQPDFVSPHRYLAVTVYFPEGNYPAYFSEMETVARLRHDTRAHKSIEAEQEAYASGGVHGLLAQRLAAAQDAFDHDGSAFNLAVAYAALGQNPNALKYLEIAYQRHDLALTEIISKREFDPLHKDPQFRALLAKIGLPPVN
ncbi:MAG: tetratricopeptide repeat protein [Candidatus Sulfotelmatobacter sp.]